MKYTVNAQPPLVHVTITEAEAKSSYRSCKCSSASTISEAIAIRSIRTLVLVTELHSACAGSHEMKEIVRTATDLDRALVTVLDAIEKLP